MPKKHSVQLRFLQELSLYCGLSLLIIFLYRQYGLFLDNSYQSLLAFDSLITLLTLGFVAKQWAMLKELLNPSRLRAKELLVLLCLAIMLGVFASATADYLNELFLYRKQRLSFLFWDTPHPRLFSILLICVQPAIIEELSYRGLIILYLQQGFKHRQIAIAGSSILFSLMHFSLMAWIWLVPLGLLLAYFRLRYRSLWYGICAHFCYNFTILWLEW